MSIQRATEILDRLIAFPTISRASNLDLIHFVRDFLARLGIAADIVHNQEGTKANIYATLGPAEVAGVLLSGHTDVVPTEGQAWSSDPFRMAQRGELLYGRGTADMKGFIACVLVLFEEYAARSFSRPLHLAFSYDEEIGCVGVRRLIDLLANRSYRPSMCVIGEPTSMQTVVAHKGKVAGRINCTGRECHSSHAPEGLNAIHLATDMVGTLRALQDELLASGARDPDFTVPFTTVHVGMINGGTALNIVPNHCSVDFEIRNIPTDNAQPLLDRLAERAMELTSHAQSRFRDTGVALEIVNAYPGLDTQPDAAVVREIQKHTNGGKLGKIAFGTEGGLFHERLGIPTVVCGPGDIRQAHQPDEFISLDQMTQCMSMLRRLADDLAA
ncbi:acetylornithine deacetylase [Aminobacter niigataensis]|uniref:acetylornithine deacetylase n=1 Tax=Aminobacter niigataensis TaxID=83265 RepID=UPI0022835347|nr:acetylornithine deacetylase [Aminobacter niigataensis]CAI2936519.1 Acetylornithine deacetylase [Aminobacter niigataensis]